MSHTLLVHDTNSSYYSTSVISNAIGAPVIHCLMLAWHFPPTLPLPRKAHCRGRGRPSGVREGDRAKVLREPRNHTIHPFSRTAFAEVTLGRPPLSCWAAKRCLDRAHTVVGLSQGANWAFLYRENMIKNCTFSLLLLAANELRVLLSGPQWLVSSYTRVCVCV